MVIQIRGVYSIYPPFANCSRKVSENSLVFIHRFFNFPWILWPLWHATGLSFKRCCTILAQFDFGSILIVRNLIHFWDHFIEPRERNQSRCPVHNTMSLLLLNLRSLWIAKKYCVVCSLPNKFYFWDLPISIWIIVFLQSGYWWKICACSAGISNPASTSVKQFFW